MGSSSTTRRLWVGIRVAALGGTFLLPVAALAELFNEAMVGPGVRSRPAYEGSSSQRGELVPVVRYLGEPWFVRSTQGVLEGGVRWGLSTDLHVGAQLAYEPGRQSSESGFLESHQVPSVSRGASVGLQMEWDHRFGPMPITLLVRSRTATQSARGTQADFRLSAGVFQSGPFSAGVFTQASWADAKSTSTYYGIGAQASASTGLPAYEPAGGLLYTSLGLLWSIDLRAPWVIVGNLEARRLHGDAAQSPLTERRSSHNAGIGLAYRF